MVICNRCGSKEVIGIKKSPFECGIDEFICRGCDIESEREYEFLSTDN